jgi:preprotein translocase subunit SecE
VTDTQETAAPAPRPSSRPRRGGPFAPIVRLVSWIVGSLQRRTRETVSEMSKVLWPSRKEMLTYTAVVIIFVVVMVAVVAALDFGFAKAVLAVFG